MNSFIYLDEYKLFSLSAQLFGGLTESFIQYIESETTKDEQQKGTYFSGNKLSDAITRSVGTQELKSFHDYAFTRFEKRMIEEKRVLQIDQDNFSDAASSISEITFISISGKAIFTDVELLAELVKNFNKIGEAIAYVGNHTQLQEYKQQEEEKITSVKDRNRRAFLRQQKNSISIIKRLAAELGLQYDAKFLDYLNFLMVNMIGNDLEISIVFKKDDQKDIYFTSLLNNEYLRESRSSLIRKYSRRTEDPLTIFGIVTQGKADLIDIPLQAEGQLDTDLEEKTFRPAIRRLVHATADIEQNFIGRVQGEYVIDPIAIFKPL